MRARIFCEGSGHQTTRKRTITCSSVMLRNVCMAGHEPSYSWALRARVATKAGTTFLGRHLVSRRLSYEYNIILREDAHTYP